MKKLFIFLIFIVAILAVGFWYRSFRLSQLNQKVYVAVEGEGKIVVFDPATSRVVSSIDLSVEHDGGLLVYAPHNVQVSPDMKTVWVTANVGKHEDHSSVISRVYAHGDEMDKAEGSEESDEVVVIDPHTDKIIKRIPVGSGLHLAHVVLTPDSSFAYVTAQKEGRLYRIDAKKFEVVDHIRLLSEGEPHGIRIAPSGATAYIAFMKAKLLGILNFSDVALSGINLSGSAVQTGVTPDGRFVTVSLYDSKQLVVLDLGLPPEAIHDVKLYDGISYINLPSSSRGPVQMYPTPDSRYVYLADQGYYFDQPIGDRIYKIDLQKLQVVKEIKAGEGPHGVVVSEDGSRVYVTNLLSGDVSVINTATDIEIGRIKVGKEPNGISVWYKP